MNFEQEARQGMFKSIFAAMGLFALWATIAFVAMHVMGCGGDVNEGDVIYFESPTTCVAGEAKACACDDGRSGSQMCAEDGKSYSACECAETPSGDAGAEAAVEAGEDAQADSQVEAEADALVDNDADAQAEADAPVTCTPEVTLQVMDGPPASYPMGTLGAMWLDIIYTVNDCADVEFTNFGAKFSDVAYTSAKNGWAGNFSNFKLTKDGSTFMGPSQIDPLSTDAAYPTFYDPQPLSKASSGHILFLVDIAPEENAPGTLIGQTFEAVILNAKATANGQDAVIHILAPNSAEKMVTAPVGQLTITASTDTPPSTIVVGGKDVWVPFAAYDFSAGSTEDILVDMVRVESLPGGDNADILQVAASVDNNIHGLGVLSAGATGAVDLVLDSGSLVIPKSGSKTVWIWAKLATPISSAAAGGAWNGVPRSGHMPALGLEEGYKQDNWDISYATKMNVRAWGAVYGMPVYADQGAPDSNAMVLRKSKPTVSKQMVSSAVLSAGEVELYRLQISADSAGSIAVRQFPFVINKTASVTLMNFRLYRNSVPVPMNEQFVVNAENNENLAISSLAAGDDNTIVVASLADEYSVSGNLGVTFSLRATASYVGMGNSVTTAIWRSTVPIVATGYLTQGAIGPFVDSTAIGNLDTANVYDGVPDVVGGFIWSDLSEIPHLGTNGHSRDWTNDVYVEDLTGSTTLSN